MTALEVAASVIVKSSIALGISYAIALVLRRQSAALRHRIWTAGLLSALVIPVLSFVLPAWHVTPARILKPAAVSAPQTVVSEAAPTSAAVPAASLKAPAVIVTPRLLFLTWLLGALTISLLLMREAGRLIRVAVGAGIVQQSSWRDMLRDISLALRLKRRVRLMRNPNASVLGTWGSLRPRVLLPRESESWTGERMRLVLGHELAHVKRNDWLVQVIAELACAVYWFNPLFWIACAELRRESEHACDDTAMRLSAPLGIDGPTYAGHVLDLARTLKHSSQPGAVALAMASTSNLERRLVAMLNPTLNRRIPGRAITVVITLLSLAVALPLAAVQSGPQTPTISVVQPFKPALEIQAPVTTTMKLAPPAATPSTQQPVVQIATARPAGYVEPAQAGAAQNATGSISGTIVDQSGAVIPGARVTLTSQLRGEIRRTVSTESGTFAFTQLPPDNYLGTADLPDFKQARFLYGLMEPGSSARFRVTLQLALTTVVDIEVQPPLGLRCFGAVGGFRSDGTPFTDAECPGRLTGTPPSYTRATFTPAPLAPQVVSPVSAPTPTVAAAGQPYPIRVGGDVQPGNLLYYPKPAYPSEARDKGIEGSVVLAGVISTDGNFRSLTIATSSNPLLETSVLETVQTWRYKPTLLNRQPIEVETTVTVNFTLGR